MIDVRKKGVGDTHEGVSKVRPMQQENQDVERKNWSYWCGPPCLVYLIRDVSYRDGMVMFQPCSAYRNLVLPASANIDVSYVPPSTISTRLEFNVLFRILGFDYHPPAGSILLDWDWK